MKLNFVEEFIKFQKLKFCPIKKMQKLLRQKYCQSFKKYNTKSFFNIPKQIEEKLEKKIYLIQNHPLNIIKNKIEDYFKKVDSTYKTFDNISPRVTTKQCFDDLLFPKEHPSRNQTDSYFFNEKECLRTHTTAHQTDLLSKGHRSFLVSGDVYRRDDIDASHF
jgi:phenylalanyl-tRNA synthetase alpha chain